MSKAGDGGEALQDTELCCHAFPTCCSLHLAPFAVKGTTTKQAKKLPAGHFFSFNFPPAAPKPDRPIARCGTNGPSALGTERGQSSRCHSPAGVPPRQRGLSRGANRGRIFPGRIFRGSISSRAGICSPLQAAPLPPFNPRGRDPRSVPAVPVRCPRSPLGVRDPRSVSATLSPCP